MSRHFRVAEVFGPTIQGEGRQAGLPCYFIRFGGCDLRCVWCDTPHAVLPELISLLPKQSMDEIIERLIALPTGPEWVVLTGGNPALLKLDELVSRMHHLRYKVMVETQGTSWNDWLLDVDELCISPKPPSSGNEVTPQILNNFLSSPGSVDRRSAYLKVVVFDDADYEYARMIHQMFPEFDFFMSAGNDDPTLPTVGHPFPEVELVGHVNVRNVVGDTYRDLAERASKDPIMADARVLPQLHVIAWGNERGR